jgi:hypothetical protein
MSDDRRRRIRGGSRLGAVARPRRPGEPNVLSNAATPNVLSNTAAPPSLIAPGLASSTTQPPSAAASSARTATQGSASAAGTSDRWLDPGRTPTAPSRGRLSISTLLFLGFLLLTGIRALGELGADQANTPVPTTVPAASDAPAGVVSFGTGSGGDCTVVGSAVTFAPGDEVWWSAEMATEQGADSDAIVIYIFDGEEFNREYTPADPDFGPWSVLCGNAPVERTVEGRYRLEVWDGKETRLQSAGEYVVKR